MLPRMLIAEMKFPVLPLLDDVGDMKGSRLWAFLASHGASPPFPTVTGPASVTSVPLTLDRSRRNERCPSFPIEACCILYCNFPRPGCQATEQSQTTSSISPSPRSNLQSRVVVVVIVIVLVGRQSPSDGPIARRPSVWQRAGSGDPAEQLLGRTETFGLVEGGPPEADVPNNVIPIPFLVLVVILILILLVLALPIPLLHPIRQPSRPHSGHVSGNISFCGGFRFPNTRPSWTLVVFDRSKPCYPVSGRVTKYKNNTQ